MPPGAAGRSPCKSVRLALVRPSEKLLGTFQMVEVVFLAPIEPDLDIDDDEEIDDEPSHENPVMGAEELLRFSRVRQLLQP